jgi:hypothetical protein
MAPKKSTTGKYPGPGYDETAPGNPSKKASTKYSPAPMSAAAKAKAAARGRLTATMTGAGKFNKAITPPAKRNVGSGGKAFTPAQIAELKKMMRSAGRLDK